MDELECENLIKSVKWTEPANLISLAILEFINVLVIGGNCLVIAAVFCSYKLRSVTNFFIVNLAVADLLVGLVVLPFSATWEVFKVWIFGDVWCRIWLAVDVWMCTASILNLCAISLDRYVAVTRPVKYPSLMSTRTAKILIAAIWTLSFAICSPPLLSLFGFSFMDSEPMVQSTYARGNYTLYYATTTTTESSSTQKQYLQHQHQQKQQQQQQQQHQQHLSGIPISSPSHPSAAAAAAAAASAQPPSPSSSLLPSKWPTSYNPYNPYDPSFAPLDTENSDVSLSMDAAATGVITTWGSNEIDAITDAMAELTLKSSTTETSLTTEAADSENVLSTATIANYTNSGPLPPCPWKCELTNNRGYVLYSAFGSFYIPMFVMLFFYWRIYLAAVRTTRAINQGFKTTKGSKGIGSRFEEQRLTLRIHRGRGSNQHDSTHSNGSTQSTTTTLGTPSPERLSKYNTRRHDKVKITVSYASSENIHELPNDATATTTTHHEHRGRSSITSPDNVLYAVHYNAANGRAITETQLYRQHHGSSNCYLQVGKSMPEIARRQSNTSDGGGGNHPHDNRSNKKVGRRNTKAHMKRFRMETKAAKTLAIIVGLFIFCWLPFFTIYLIRAFCDDCIDPLLFSILFWLGYCNSAVNPMLYALFSKDFRFAFKRIICRCFQSISLKSSRRGSDMSAVNVNARTPSITPSMAAHSFGGVTEIHHSEVNSDSR